MHLDHSAKINLKIAVPSFKRPWGQNSPTWNLLRCSPHVPPVLIRSLMFVACNTQVPVPTQSDSSQNSTVRPWDLEAARRARAHRLWHHSKITGICDPHEETPSKTTNAVPELIGAEKWDNILFQSLVLQASEAVKARFGCCNVPAGR